MRGIRKFVGCIKVAAGLGTVVVLGLSMQTASAHVAAAASSGPATDLTSISPDCLAALQAIRDALVADRQEDADELHNPNPSGEAAEDSAEVAQFTPLVSNLRTACATVIAAIKAQTAVPPATTTPSACVTAVQAWKAFARSLWLQHTPPTTAEQTELRTLSQAVRSACGWSWADWSFDHT
jgi:hypothetical protein